MKIAVNTRFLIKDRLEGIGWFTYETLKRITRAHPEHEFIFCFDRNYDNDFIFSDNITPQIVLPPARHPFLWYYWFEHKLPGALKKHHPDFFISTDGFLPLSVALKSLLVVHDIAFEHYPRDVPFLARKYYRHFSRMYTNKADRIATVSAYSKNDLVKTYGTEDRKVDVVYNGVNEAFHPLSASEKEKVKDRYTNGRDYLIYVGALHPRKNVVNLLKAFEAFKSTDSLNIKLVIAGRKAWGNAAMEEYYQSMRFKNDVIFTGHLLVDELAKVVGTAKAMVYISYFEGFGIPLVEAMYSGIPIIASSCTSIPEVVGEAALLVDPFSVDAIVKAIQKLLADEHLQQQLIVKGNKQKLKFSWDKTAERLWQSFEKMMDS